MKHLRLFEEFNASKKVQYRITIPGCVPDGNWDNPGHWSQYNPTITVTLENLPAISGLVDLFSLDLEEEAVKSIQQGSFEVDMDGITDEISGADACFGREYLMGLAFDSTLTEFADSVHENFYDFILSWYRQNYTRKEDSDDYENGINDEALREIMFDQSRVKIERI
jgi:hypothetical protein